MHIRDLLTTRNPLGPFRHETIIKRAEAASSNMLIYQTQAFDEIIEEGRPIIVGRRGAGKTAIVAALVSSSGCEEYSYERSREIKSNGDIYVLINSWDHLDQLVDQVGQDARHSIGGDGDWSSLLPETTARHWARRLWMVIFERIYRDSLYDRVLRAKLPLVTKYVEGRDIVAPTQEITDSLLNEKFSQVRKSVLNYLSENNKNCFLVIDSLDEYPVLAPRFQKLMAGLLKCVNDFNADYPRLRIVCCIPEEVEPFFVARSSNHLKDLSSTSSVSKLRWRPIDLLRIVAERYREFLLLHSHDDKVFTKRITKFNLSRRDDIRNFYSLVMPDSIQNRLGRPESAVAYVIRHTQLLPREFLMIFDAAITASHKMRGSWRYIEPLAIVKAIEVQEPELAIQILSPYKTTYPELLSAAQEILPEMAPICTLNDLDRLGARLSKMTRHETSSPWETLFQIGVIGYVDERLKGSSDRYEYGRFHFNSARPITFAAGRRYCVHPIFSGSWELKRDNENIKCVYPADIKEIPWED